jgi:hypothetical protein
MDALSGHSVLSIALTDLPWRTGDDDQRFMRFSFSDVWSSSAVSCACACSSSSYAI